MYLDNIPIIQKDALNIQNLLNLALFLLLTFLGVAARISIDIEIFNKKFKQTRFLHRYFIATVLSYIIEFFIAERSSLRKYYSEIIIVFCIFVNDIVIFIFSQRVKLFGYLVRVITKGFVDLSKSIDKKNESDSSNQ